jgi:hypothetical protein
MFPKYGGTKALIARRLEALPSASRIAVRLINLIFLQAVAFVCFIASDNAASRRSQ